MQCKPWSISGNDGDENNGGASGRWGKLTLKLDGQTLDVM